MREFGAVFKRPETLQPAQCWLSLSSNHSPEIVLWLYRAGLSKR